MFFEPAKGHGLPHDPFTALVAPRPIGWISTRAADGTLNLAPYSYFNALATKPYLVWFSSEYPKDSALAAIETGEFVVNIVGRTFAEQMNATSVDAPREINELELAGLGSAPSRLVKPPRVEGIPAALECVVTGTVEPRGTNPDDGGPTVVIGEVVGVYIDDSMLVDGRYDIVAAGNVSRLGYRDFASVTETFVMRRPRWGRDIG